LAASFFFIPNHSQRFNLFYFFIILFHQDASITVRKKAVRVLKEIVEQHNNPEKAGFICNVLLSRMGDQELAAVCSSL
jgi:hypothetical protein